MRSPPHRTAALAFAGTSSLSAQGTDTVARPATRPVRAGIAVLRQEIAIGLADGDEPYLLGAIGDTAVAPSGNIYVWDSSIPAIRMYDAAGKYLKTIGRQGGGPGEYQSGAAIAVAGASQGAGLMTVDTAGFIYINTIITHRVQGKPSSPATGWRRPRPRPAMKWSCPASGVSLFDV